MAVINRFPTGGGIPDDLTADPSVVASGYKFVGGSTDEIETGTLQLSGNAKTSHVLKNNTFYDTDLKIKRTGTMEVANVINLILSVSSGRVITVKWTNPVSTSGRPYSGVYVRYQTGSYPTPTTGTQAYKGVGSSSASGAQSTITLTMPSLSTTYYFIVYSYCTTSNGELLGNQLKGTIVTGSSQVVTITSSKNYTIPAGYTSMDIFGIGGGGAGATADWDSRTTGGGGGSGYTTTVKNISISAGQVLNCTIGSGGTSAGSSTIYGGITKVVRNGTTLLEAMGSGGTYRNYYGGSGGSGGGRGGTSTGNGYAGGTNGGYGEGSGGGSGQMSTTRAFGESNGTLYGGGGGGGGGVEGSGGAGGAGGGANGGGGSSNGANASANTGSGGGGGGRFNFGGNEGQGGSGSAGIILIRLK